jgi:CheY-like chemotaxis protein
VVALPSLPHALDLIEAANAPRFDLLVADLRASREGGVDLVMRLEERQPQAKVMYTSRAVNEPDGAGRVHAFLRKPYTVTELIRAIAVTLGR